MPRLCAQRAAGASPHCTPATTRCAPGPRAALTVRATPSTRAPPITKCFAMGRAKRVPNDAKIFWKFFRNWLARREITRATSSRRQLIACARRVVALRLPCPLIGRARARRTCLAPHDAPSGCAKLSRMRRSGRVPPGESLNARRHNLLRSFWREPARTTQHRQSRGARQTLPTRHRLVLLQAAVALVCQITEQRRHVETVPHQETQQRHRPRGHHRDAQRGHDAPPRVAQSE